MVRGELEADIATFTKLMEEVLVDEVGKVCVSERGADSRCTITSSEHGPSANMQHT